MNFLAAVAATSLAMGAATGWFARDVFADRSALRLQNERLSSLADAERKARDAAADYARKRDEIAPVVRVVRIQSEPVIKYLDRCDLPATAGGLLNRAANAADGVADRADGTGSTTAVAGTGKTDRR